MADHDTFELVNDDDTMSDGWFNGCYKSVCRHEGSDNGTIVTSSNTSYPTTPDVVKTISANTVQNGVLVIACLGAYRSQNSPFGATTASLKVSYDGTQKAEVTRIARTRLVDGSDDMDFWIDDEAVRTFFFFIDEPDFSSDVDIELSLKVSTTDSDSEARLTYTILSL